METRYYILADLYFHNPTTARGYPYEDASIIVVAIDTGGIAKPGEWKAYIGYGKGIKKEADLQRVAAYGSQLSPLVGTSFFPWLPADKYKPY